MSNYAWDLISYNQQQNFNKHSVIWAAENDKQYDELYNTLVRENGLQIKPCDLDCKCDHENGCCNATA